MARDSRCLQCVTLESKIDLSEFYISYCEICATSTAGRYNAIIKPQSVPLAKSVATPTLSLYRCDNVTSRRCNQSSLVSWLPACIRFNFTTRTWLLCMDNHMVNNAPISSLSQVSSYSDTVSLLLWQCHVSTLQSELTCAMAAGVH